ncbi:precorrin-3B synthase [Streptomyces olivoverticillatus]|uniref:Precorrin-3B synthase n=1 Tax=Streptomyces olivoverticillatus TaxID=66427 RepID=A0A7W7LN63_9ACTN|nr:precorrin-3B synthase [Streptomyces olivoverticillatus]MBB4893172.1 precorrin-3B synthase [Streptomyces olivoverticillatus]
MPALPARDRADACPGALRLHAADDGALARVRLPGGLLTARQAVALADAADELGDGHLDITSRGNVQLRGLPDGCGAALGARLRKAGLLPSDRHDRIRNIVASPLCGLDAGGAEADVQEWARALDALLCAQDAPNNLPNAGDLSELSGRFLFGLDDGRGDIAALRPDVTLIASAGGGAYEGAALLCFGTEGPALRIAADDAPRAAAVAALAFLAAARESGTGAWRVRDLDPERRPRPDRLADRLASAGIGCELVPDASLPFGSPAPPGLVHGRDGLWALSAAAPLGRLTTAQWRLLAEAAEQDGDGELRVTPWRGVVVPGLSAEAAAARLAALAEAGLVTSAESPWHRAGACAGRPGCVKSLADVRADASACLTGARPGGPGGLPVYWSGCERRCGHPGGRWVDVLATGEGYRVAVRDGASDETDDEAAGTVSAAELADAVAAARTTT